MERLPRSSAIRLAPPLVRHFFVPRCPRNKFYTKIPGFFAELLRKSGRRKVYIHRFHIMRIGEILVQLGMLTPEQLQATLEARDLLGGRMGTQLIERGLVNTE